MQILIDVKQSRLVLLSQQPILLPLWLRDTWRLALVIICAFIITTAVSSSAFYNLNDTTSYYEQTTATLINALKKARFEQSIQPSSNASKPLSQADVFSGAKAASQRQWGPSLVMANQVSKKHYYGFDPQVKQQQQYLMALGFDLANADGFKGPGTRRVIAEFRALYLPETSVHIQDADLTIVMQAFVKLAQQDAARYGIDQGVAAAIRISSMRTGVELSYLMKLAKTESSFNPQSEARNSSAAGLYQFTKNTWLNTLKKHGAKYGVVADLAANIRYSSRRVGPYVRNRAIYQHLLDLRKNPRLAAMMAAETVRDHQQKLVKSLDRKPTETDLYLAHFLGINNAITFLQSMKQSPDIQAVELFPRAANNNRNIFQPGKSKPRTVNEVYAFLDEKFSTSRK